MTCYTVLQDFLKNYYIPSRIVTTLMKGCLASDREAPALYFYTVLSTPSLQLLPNPHGNVVPKRTPFTGQIDLFFICIGLGFYFKEFSLA